MVQSVGYIEGRKHLTCTVDLQVLREIAAGRDGGCPFRDRVLMQTYGAASYMNLTDCSATCLHNVATQAHQRRRELALSVRDCRCILLGDREDLSQSVVRRDDR